MKLVDLEHYSGYTWINEYLEIYFEQRREMFLSEDENKLQYHDSTVCAICQRKISRAFRLRNGLVVCEEHRSEFKRRQREGVSTAELDLFWGDTLENWRERPPELEKEARPRFLATPFLLWKKDEVWLIFARCYTHLEWPRRSRPEAIIRNPRMDFWWRFRRYKRHPPFHRLPDHIVIQRETGEIRRFVNVTSKEVFDDVQGIRPARAQAELALFWDKRQSRGLREKARFLSPTSR